MDIIEYIKGDDKRLEELAKRSRLQIVRLKRLVTNPLQPVRYMTAKRLHHASGGQITIEELGKRGAMRGRDTFSGPLGEAIAEIACKGEDVPTRLASAGIASDHFTEILLRGRVPSPSRMRAYLEAFPGLTKDIFAQHAQWRRHMREGKSI